MKNLKLGILACGAVLLLLMLTNHVVESLKGDALNTILVLVGAAVPTALGAMGLAKPPFLQWQAVASLAGFVLIAVKLKLWDTLPHIGDAPTKMKIMLIALVVGLVVSAMAIAKPEAKA